MRRQYYPYSVWYTLKQVRSIKICLNETYSIVHIGEYLSNTFPIQNCLKQKGALLPLISN
jgi:hypothetical protein